MPEGDTLHNVARVLRPQLIEQRVLAARLGRTTAPLLVGRVITEVEAIGKHLLIHCGEAPSGWVLRVHLGMHGSWHSYAPDEPWKRPQWQANVVVHTPNVVAVCFNAEDVECLRSQELYVAGSRIHALGPDLLGEAVDFDVILRRVSTTRADTPMCDVLLNQHLAAGIGNVYKCELLFLEHMHPLLPRREVSDDAMRKIFEHARALMQRNVGGTFQRITTTDDQPGRLWVYARKGKPCRLCETPIEQRVMGARRRSTYWCPKCQPVPVVTPRVLVPKTV